MNKLVNIPVGTQSGTYYMQVAKTLHEVRVSSSTYNEFLVKIKDYDISRSYAHKFLKIHKELSDSLPSDIDNLSFRDLYNLAKLNDKPVIKSADYIVRKVDTMNKLTFDQAYELRSKLLAKLSNLVIKGKITTAQYKARVQRANEYTLGKYRD